MKDAVAVAHREGVAEGFLFAELERCGGGLRHRLQIRRGFRFAEFRGRLHLPLVGLGDCLERGAFLQEILAEIVRTVGEPLAGVHQIFALARLFRFA